MPNTTASPQRTASASAAHRPVIDLADCRERLVRHRIYGLVNSAARLRRFMESHVFAVWDFQSLLKAMQQRLTCTSIPWVPTPDAEARRLVNEIVLDEESDALPEGGSASHFELYLHGMRNAGADTGPIDRMIETLRAGVSQVGKPAATGRQGVHGVSQVGKPAATGRQETAERMGKDVDGVSQIRKPAATVGQEADGVSQVGKPAATGRQETAERMGQDGAGVSKGGKSVATVVGDAMREAGAPEAAQAFVRHSFAVIESGSTHGIVAAFTYGREDVIPDMFRGLVSSLASRDPAWERFHWYLDRHIEADEEKHAPVCRRIMARLCGDDPARWAEASQVARACVESRIALWDAIAAELEAMPAE